jgi:hypothetical protein
MSVEQQVYEMLKAIVVNGTISVVNVNVEEE